MVYFLLSWLVLTFASSNVWWWDWVEMVVGLSRDGIFPPLLWLVLPFGTPNFW
jgi:hypothetical protein